VKESASPQWVYTHPEEGAPRAGEGVYPSKVLEVVQVGGLVLLRSCWSLERTDSRSVANRAHTILGVCA